MLFNQFHDLICGCHVDEAFSSAMTRYGHSELVASPILQKSLEAIISQIDTRGEGVAVVVFNPLGWSRTDCVECCVAFSEPDVFDIDVRDSAGRSVPCDGIRVDRYETGAIRRAVIAFIATDVPSLGYEVYRVVRADAPASPTDLNTNQRYEGLRADQHVGVLENAHLRLELDLWSGAIRSLHDKSGGWEVVPESFPFGNVIVREQDCGNFWQYNGPCRGDAFSPMPGRYPLPAIESPRADFSANYHGDGTIRSGRAMAQMAIEHPFGEGHFATRVRVYAGLPRIDIRTTLINRDRRVRYRMALPTTIRDGSIVHEIPFGAIERGEGEFPAQNWIDYTGDGRGVGLLNRGLPGNNVVDGVMMLSLLKCTAIKEGYAEVGGFKLETPTEGGYEIGKTHTFDYAIVPHTGDWREARLYRHGAQFNAPLIALTAAGHDGPLPPRMSFAEVSADNVVLSTLRSSEGGTVVRVYEAQGRSTQGARLRLFRPIRRCCRTNLIETECQAVEIEDNRKGFRFDLNPFEIKTFRVDTE